MHHEDHCAAPIDARALEHQGAANPWLTASPSTPPASQAPATALEQRAQPQTPLSGPPAPHRAVPGPGLGAGLGIRRHPGGARVWWLGVHGGSGESTLAALMPTSREAEHAWPDVAAAPPAVVLLARLNAHGLARCQAAAAQWAAAQTPPVRLLGVALIADAPGSAPAPLREWAKVLSGGVPRVWHLPWSEPLRLGADPSSLRPPRPLRRLLADVEALTSPPSPPTPKEVPHAAHAAARI